MKTILLPFKSQISPINSFTPDRATNYAGNVANKQRLMVSSRKRAKWHFVSLVFLLLMIQQVSWGQQFWYKADGTVAYDGTTWHDETNVNNAGRTGGTISLTPNAINFNPSLSLTNISRQFQIASTTNVQSFVIVNNPIVGTGAMQQAGGLIGYGATGTDLGIRLNANLAQWIENGNSNDWSNGGSGRINGVSGFAFSGWNIVNQYAPSAHNYRYFIGGYYNGTARPYYGSIAEVIAFSSAVPNPNNLETYLAVKYGITLGHDYLNGSGSTVYAISGYANNVAGLGNDATYGLKQSISSSTTAAGSSKIIIATTNDFASANPGRTSLTSGQYLIWGHNNGATNAWTTSGLYSIVNRIWKAQNTSSVGAVYFQIDLSGYPTPVSGSYTLLVDNDGNFGNGGTSEFILTHSSGALYTANVTFPSGTSYFTIAQTVLPTITLGTISSICAGVTSFKIPYTATSGSPDQYSISGTGISEVTNGPLGPSPITVTLSSPASAGPLSFALTVRNSGSGVVSSNVNGSVTVNSLPVANSSQTPITCFGANNATITISASGGLSPYTFSVEEPANWLNATGTDLRLFTGLLPNTPYRVRVKDSNGCISK